MFVYFLYHGNFHLHTSTTKVSRATPKEGCTDTALEGSGTAEETDAVEVQPETNPSEPLITLVKLYTLADKYDVPALKKLSTTKFQDNLLWEWENGSFTSSIRLLYDETLEDDRMLKDAIMAFAGLKVATLMDREDFVGLIKERGEIGVR